MRSIDRQNSWYMIGSVQQVWESPLPTAISLDIDIGSRRIPKGPISRLFLNREWAK